MGTLSNGRYAVAALAIAALAIFSDLYATQPLLPLLSHDFGVGAATAGLTISVVVGVIAVASGVFGPLSDLLGCKSVMVVSGMALSLTTLACAFAPTFPALVALRAAQGLAIPGINAVAIVYIGSHYPRERVGALVGLFIGFSGLGGLSGRVIAGFLADRFDWRAPFVAYALFTLLATLLMAWALAGRTSRAQHTDSRQLLAAYGDMAAHLRDRRLLGAFAIGSTLFFGFIGIFTYLPYKLSGAPFFLSTSAIASVYFCYVAGVLVSPVSGALSRRGSIQRHMSIGIAIAAAGILLTLSESLPVIIIGTVVLCIGLFSVQSIAPAYVNAVAVGAKGSANALYQTFYYSGAVVGATLPGLAWEHWAWPGVIVTCGVSLALAYAATFLLRPRVQSAMKPAPSTV